MDSLISRRAAIDALNRIFDRCEEIEAHLPEGDPDKTGYRMYPDYITVWKYLHQLPSAQPERTGKWIYDDEAYPGGNPYGHYECSVCGESVPNKTNYCPNCGADMRGEE